MSSRRRRREAPLPPTSAGLMRFFEEETEGVKLRPEVVIIAAVFLIVLCVIARILW